MDKPIITSPALDTALLMTKLIIKPNIKKSNVFQLIALTKILKKAKYDFYRVFSLLSL